jgi:thiol-disulfide isomerase/thioredoxin
MDIAPSTDTLPPALHPTPAGEPEFLVACLCADWCGTCRDYQPGFLAIAAAFPQARFVWLDIENEADTLEELEDMDVENFPTLLIQRRISSSPANTPTDTSTPRPVLFFGVMLPHLQHLQRTLETFVAQTPAEALDYATRNPERLAWQHSRDLWALLSSSPATTTAE